MAVTPSEVRLVRFSPFEVDFGTGELRKHGVRVRLPEQSLEILRALVERPGELVSRESLRARLWPDGTFVDFEHGLNAAVRRLRDVLGDTAREPRFVETLPRRGYRFIGTLDARELVAEEGAGRPPVPAGKQEEDEENETTVPAPARPARRRNFVRAALVGAGLLVLAAIAIIWFRSTPPRAVMSLDVVPLTSLPGEEVSPTFSPDGSQVAFGWAETPAARGGGFDLYSKVIGSEKLLRLTRRPGYWISPAWSPDGRSIAFSRWRDDESGIYLVPALGGEERRIASVAYGYPPLMGIAWSPDGATLVFADNTSSSLLSTLSLGSLERRPLRTDTTCLMAGNPTFSPDGREVAFTCNADYGTYGIYTVPREGGTATRRAQIMGNPLGLAWSRDGARIVFSNDPGINEGRLWSLDLATARASSLRSTDDARQPAFSPDGGRVAFERARDSVNIWKVDPRPGGTSRAFIVSTRIQFSARFSPDGRHVAFQSTRSGAHEIWLADADGSNPVQATDFGAGISGSPSWCGDSRRIAFDSRVDGPASVFVEDISDRIPHRVGASLGEISLPTWSEDCRYLYVASGPAKKALLRVPVGGGPAEEAYSGIALNPTESGGGALLFADAFENARICRLERGQRQAQELPEMPRVRFGTAWQLVRGGIYFVDARSPQAGVVSYYDLATHSTRRVAQLPRQVVPWTPLSVSPVDGAIVFSQVDEEASDLMLAQFGPTRPRRPPS